MFGRKRRSRLDEVVETVEPYAETAREVVADQEARRLGIAALTSLLLLRRRWLATTGIAGLAWLLANDPQLRGQLNQLAGDLGGFKARAQRARARRRRRILVGLVGSGAAASAAVAYARSRGPVDVEDSVEVGVPVETAYNQWTQFEEFPRFMEGIDEVRQLDDTHLHWVASSSAGHKREWNAEISEQRPDERVAWHAISGKRNAGVVTFHRLGDERSKVMVQLEFEPEGLRETVGSILGLDRRRIKGDLQRFSELVEGRGVESGAWRGTVEHGTVIR